MKRPSSCQSVRVGTYDFENPDLLNAYSESQSNCYCHDSVRTRALTIRCPPPLVIHQKNQLRFSATSQALLTCVFNMSWIVAWHYLQIELSVLIMLLFLSTLIQLFLKTKSMANDLTLIQRFILQTPFIVYLGWISVATIANITALLVAYKWTALSIAPVYWSAAMILIAIVLALLMVKKFQVISFTLVVAWALWGIYNAQGPAAPILARLTAAGIGLLITAVLFRFIQKFRESRMAK